MQEINVDKIMGEIREEIKEKGIQNQPLEFADINRATDILELPKKYDKDMMHRELVNLNGIWDTSLEELPGGNSLKRAVKKVIRRAVGMVVNSHVARQVAFNASVVDSINMLDCLSGENEVLKEEVKQMKKEMRQLKEEIEQLKEEPGR